MTALVILLMLVFIILTIEEPTFDMLTFATKETLAFGNLY